jgi:parallel beta-helix repeat protein
LKWTKGWSIGIVVAIVLASIGVAFVLLESPSVGKIHIDNDTELMDQVKKFGWSGDGSIGDPVRITGLKINITGIAPCIYIGNTTKHIIISQCDLTINYDEPGMLNGAGNIILFNVQNATIENNRISSGSSGIELRQCTNDVIKDNKVQRTDMIILMDKSSENTLIGNNGTSDSGIIIQWSDNNTVTGNVFHATNFSSNQLLSSNDNMFDNNTFYAVEGSGLIVDDSNRNTFSNNTFMGTTIGPGSTRGVIGLVLNGSSENRFDHNQMKGGGYFGIGLSMVGSNGNTFDLNSVIGPHGIYMADSNDNVIKKNDLTGSHFSIIVMSSSDGNTIAGNDMVGWNTDAGILMVDSNDNVITDNEIVGQQNTNYLIKMQGSQGNLVTYNDLISLRDMSLLDPKPKLAFDDSGLNRWNDTSQGNYWSDWTTPDADVNGIVDLPYVLDGGAGATDWYPSSVPFFT